MTKWDAWAISYSSTFSLRMILGPSTGSYLADTIHWSSLREFAPMESPHYTAATLHPTTFRESSGSEPREHTRRNREGHVAENCPRIRSAP